MPKFGKNTIFVPLSELPPPEARYILELLGDGSYRLVEYVNNSQDFVVLAEFPVTFFKCEFYEHVKAARKLIGKRKLYVESPFDNYDFKADEDAFL